MGRQLTDVQRIVISTETIDDGLVLGRLVMQDPVWLAVLWNRDRLRRACNPLDVWFSGRFCAKIKCCTLEICGKDVSTHMMIEQQYERTWIFA